MKGFHYATMSYAEARERLAVALFREMDGGDWSAISEDAREKHRTAIDHLIDHRGWILSALTGDLTDHDKLRGSAVKHMARALRGGEVLSHKAKTECPKCGCTHDVSVVVPEEKLHDALHVSLHATFAQKVE